MNNQRHETTNIRQRSASFSGGSERISMTEQEFRQINLEFWLKIDSLEQELAREREEKSKYQKSISDREDELKKVTKELRNSLRKNLEDKNYIKSLEKRNDELKSTRSRLEIQINKYKEEIRGLNRGIMRRDLKKPTRKYDNSRRKSDSSTKTSDQNPSSTSSDSSRQVFIRTEKPTTSSANSERKKQHESGEARLANPVVDNKRDVFIPDRLVTAPVPPPFAGNSRKISFKIASRQTPAQEFAGVFMNDASSTTNQTVAGSSITGLSRNNPTNQLEPFRCPLCNDRFLNLPNLQFHHRFEHARANPFTCRLCAFSHSDYMMVKNHMKHHEMDKQAPTSARCKIADCNVFSRNVVELAQHQAKYH